MIQAPIFHVNAEDPEAAVWLAELCVEFRQTFHRDVVIDLICYRKHGHNEGDNPAFTQPVMYAKIKNRPSQLQIYEEHLVVHGDLTADEALAVDEKFQEKLKKAQEEVKKTPPQKRGMHGFAGRWKGFEPRYDFTPVRTGVPFETLREVTDRVIADAGGFHAQSEIARIFETPADAAHRAQADRLGVRRDAGVRLAAARRHARSAERPGQPARHVQPAARGRLRRQDRRRVTCR